MDQKRLTLATLIGLLSCANSTEEPSEVNSNPEVRYEFHDPEAPGPYGVGRFEIKLVLPETEREVVAQIQYPTEADGLPARARGPFPCLLFSHGNRMVPKRYQHLLDHLATHGYVVAAPLHPGSTTLDNSTLNPLLVVGSALERPGEIYAVLDEVLRLSHQDSPLRGLIHEARVGISGQSFGGLTTLVVAGASLDAQLPLPLSAGQTLTYSDYCESIDWGSTACRKLKEALLGSGRLRLADPRFRAALSMTPPAFELYGAEGLGEVQIPTLVLAGELDVPVNYQEDILPIYDSLPGPKWLVTAQQAGHNGTNDLCGAKPPIDQTPASYCPVSLAYTRTFTTAFFGWKLKDVVEYQSYLTTEYASKLDSIRLESKP